MAPQNPQTRLERNRELYGSPPFPERPAINAGEATTVYYRSNERPAKYFPLDKLKVANQSNVDVVIYLDTNPDRALYVEANTQEIFEDILPFRSYKVENLDPASGNNISSGELTITARKQPMDADQQARKQFEQQGQNGLGLGELAGLANLLG